MKFETNGFICGLCLGFGLTGVGFLAGEMVGVALGILVAIGILMINWRKGD